MANKQIHRYADNTGGSNLRDNEARVNNSTQTTECVLINNMEIYKGGGYSSQGGNVQVNTSVSDTSAVLGIGEFKLGTTIYCIYIKASGNAYASVAGGGPDGTAIKTGLSTSAIPQFITYNAKVIVFNGVDTPWSWNGVTSSNLTGLPAAWTTTKPFAAAVFGGKRIFALAGSTIYYCALGNENDWTTANDAGSISNLFNDTTLLTAISDYGTRLAIHSAKPAIYLLAGSAPADYAAAPIASNRAATSKLGIATINDYQFFFSGDAILPVVTTELGAVKLGKDNEISSKIKPFITATDSEIPLSAVDQTKLDTPILIPHYAKNNLIGYFKTIGSTVYDTAAVFNFDRGTWVFRQASPVTAASIVAGSVLTGTSDGKILKEFSGVSTVNGNFTKSALTCWFDWGTPMRKKRITRFYIWFKTSTTVDVDLKVRVDYKTDIEVFRTIEQDTMSSGGSYGSASYGVDTYSSSGVYYVQFPVNADGKAFQFEFIGATSNLDFRIIQYAVEVEELGDY